MPSDYKRIRKEVEWHFLRDFEIKQILNKSDIQVSIYDKDLCVGVGRCVTDNVNLFLICDVMVMKDYQGKGVGKLVVNKLISKLYNYVDEGESFQLEASPTADNREFYIKCGLK